MRQKMKINKFLICAFVFILHSSPANAEFKAKIDRSSINVNETLKLELILDKQVFSGEPDTAGLSKDFEILGNNRQQSFSSINGQTKSSTTWTLTLRPKLSGKLKIPSISFRGEKTDEITVDVRNANNSKIFNPGDQIIFTETEVDNKSVYVNQQIILTIRLFTAVNLQDYSITGLQIPNAETYRLSDTNYQKVLNGRNYLALEIKYAIYPKNPGELKIPKLRFSAYEIDPRNQFSLFNNRGNQVIRDTQLLSINVLDIPSESTAINWLPSKNVEISQRWSENFNDATVGEPITRTIVIKASGNTSAQIPPTNIENIENLRVYPDQPQINQEISAEGLLAKRTEVFAIVPNAAGTLLIPELRVDWWDTESNSQRSTTLPSQMIAVKADNKINLDDSLEEIPLSENDSDFLSQTISDVSIYKNPLIVFLVISNVSLLFIVVLMIRKITVKSTLNKEKYNHKSDDGKNDSLKSALWKLKSAIRKKDMPMVRNSLLQWGQIAYPNIQPITLKSIAEMLKDDDLLITFGLLDNHLFGDIENKIQLSDLHTIEKKISSQTAYLAKIETKKNKSKPLQPLYPI